eukprot:CAMPEP_0178792206 /NCGR_PEP_ID=MMETSP0745-20121128/8395_1 /TAXON_ID=913974 /ORGANISM="Nitzschia punctata, Strain CCMP561" /LENGTH=68 /DNA_ID=CAMNT_0020450369 /DNA_START=94 /DNA_END=297 /DNA_ORIENTATION=-
MKSVTAIVAILVWGDPRMGGQPPTGVAEHICHGRTSSSIDKSIGGIDPVAFSDRDAVLETTSAEHDGW